MSPCEKNRPPTTTFKQAADLGTALKGRNSVAPNILAGPESVRRTERGKRGGRGGVRWRLGTEKCVCESAEGKRALGTVLEGIEADPPAHKQEATATSGGEKMYQKRQSMAPWQRLTTAVQRSGLVLEKHAREKSGACVF